MFKADVPASKGQYRPVNFVLKMGGFWGGKRPTAFYTSVGSAWQYWPMFEAWMERDNRNLSEP